MSSLERFRRRLGALPRSTRLAFGWLAALVGAGALLALGLSLAWTPEAMATGEPLRMVGITPEPCPGCPLCGMSRAFASMSHLDPARAVAFNPGVVLLYPLFLALAVLGPALALRTLIPRSTPCASSPKS